MRRPLGNEQGFVLLMAMMLVAIVSVAGVLISTNVTSMLTMGKTAKAEVVFDSINQKIMAAVYNDEVWSNLTSASNACRTTGLGCGANSAAIGIDLVDLQGTVINASVSPTAGYTNRGEPCSTFSSAGNDQCPARFEVKWAPVNCKGSVCDIEISSTFIYKPKSDSASKLNPKNYSFRVARGRESGSLREACTSMGGHFDQARNLCHLEIWTQTCPAGQYLVQAYSRGDATCKPLLGYGMNCPEGSAAIGVLADGSLDCRSTLDWK